MVTVGIDFSRVNQMGSYLFLICRSSAVVIMTDLLKAISDTQEDYVLTKGLFVLLPIRSEF